MRRRGIDDNHLAALLETAQRRRLKPVMLEDVKVDVTIIDPSPHR